MNKFRPTKKVLLSALTVCGILIIAAGVGIGLRMYQDKKIAEEDTSITGRQLPADVDEAQNLRVSGDLDGSLQKIEEELDDNNSSNQEKYLLFIQQGNVHVEKGDNQAALDSYLSAEKLDKTYEIVSLLASQYELMGNKSKAVEYYKRSIPLIPDESPMKARYKEMAEEKIRQLEEA